MPLVLDIKTEASTLTALVLCMYTLFSSLPLPSDKVKLVLTEKSQVIRMQNVGGICQRHMYGYISNLLGRFGVTMSSSSGNLGTLRLMGEKARLDSFNRTNSHACISRGYKKVPQWRIVFLYAESSKIDCRQMRVLDTCLIG